MSWHDTTSLEFHLGRPTSSTYVIPPDGAAPPVRCHRPVIRKRASDSAWTVSIRYRAPYYGGSFHARRTWAEALDLALEYVR